MSDISHEAVVVSYSVSYLVESRENAQEIIDALDEAPGVAGVDRFEVDVVRHISDAEVTWRGLEASGGTEGGDAA